MIKSAKFIKSIADIRSYREFSLAGSAPEICVVGRSNVGKSSFINFLTRRKKLAKTSSTPGRTRLINLFDIDEGRFVLVDTDCMEIHNVCRHQCNLTDVGRYKVDAVAERILQINPQAQVKRFYQRIQEVPREKYQEWITPENAIFIGTCDNRVGDAVACDLAYSFGAPFAALGFMTRAWAGEIYTCLPERHEICYRCAFKTQIDNSIAEERRNHFYIGEEELEKAHFEPGLDVDLEFGISLFDKVVLDILNRNNPQYIPRIYHKMTQFTVFTGTDDRTFADPFWRKAFPTPVALRSLRHSDSCRRCEYCTK